MLHTAVQSGSLPIVRYFVEVLGIDLTEMVPFYNNALFVAIVHGAQDCVEYFVEHCKMDLNQIPSLSIEHRGWIRDLSPSSLAAAVGNLPALRYFVEVHGVQLNRWRWKFVLMLKNNKQFACAEYLDRCNLNKRLELINRYQAKGLTEKAALVLTNPQYRGYVLLFASVAFDRQSYFERQFPLDVYWILFDYVLGSHLHLDRGDFQSIAFIVAKQLATSQLNEHAGLFQKNSGRAKKMIRAVEDARNVPALKDSMIRESEALEQLGEEMPGDYRELTMIWADRSRVEPKRLSAEFNEPNRNPFPNTPEPIPESDDDIELAAM